MLNAVKNLYREDALVPATPWIKTKKIMTPTLSGAKSGDGYRVNWDSKENGTVFRWVLFAKYGDTWETKILDRDHTGKTLPLTRNGKKLNTVAIKAIDRLSNESDYDAVKL